MIYLPVQVLTLAWSQMCPRTCQCPKEPPICPPGVQLILDDCACCLVCVRQKGQLCADLYPCDTHRGLHCDYTADVQKRTGICTGECQHIHSEITHCCQKSHKLSLYVSTAQEGHVCVLDGAVYQNGQIFFPSCKYQCICRDGQIGCVPRCNVDVMLPGPDCVMPRRVQIPGECCEKWVCEAPTEAGALGVFAMAGE